MLLIWYSICCDISNDNLAFSWPPDHILAHCYQSKGGYLQNVCSSASISPFFREMHFTWLEHKWGLNSKQSRECKNLVSYYMVLVRHIDMSLHSLVEPTACAVYGILIWFVIVRVIQRFTVVVLTWNPLESMYLLSTELSILVALVDIK